MVLLQCAPHQLFVCTTLNAGIGKLVWKHRHLKHRGEDRELLDPQPLTLNCGSENNLNLTAVMSGLPSSQHTHDLTELCSRYDEDDV